MSHKPKPAPKPRPAPRPKSNVPEPAQSVLDEEIRGLHAVVRQTLRLLASGKIDFQVGANLLTRASNAEARLHLARHPITPFPDQSPESRIQSEVRRILIAAGLGPRD